MLIRENKIAAKCGCYHHQNYELHLAAMQWHQYICPCWPPITTWQESLKAVLSAIWSVTVQWECCALFMHVLVFTFMPWLLAHYMIKHFGMSCGWKDIPHEHEVWYFAMWYAFFQNHRKLQFRIFEGQTWLKPWYKRKPNVTCMTLLDT